MNMNQAQMMKLRKMQKEMMEAQERLENTVFEGTAGGAVTGNHEVVEINIDPEAIDDVEMVQDMLVSALNDVNKKIEAETQKLMGGFNGMGLF